MSTTLLLARHAQTESNVAGRYMGWTDEDLSQRGVGEAERLARRLSRRPIRAVYSSPLRRALRTAEIVALPHSLPVLALDGFGEIRLGQWEGMHGTEIAARFPELWRAWRHDPTGIQMPGGESLAQVQARAVAAFQHVCQTNHGEHALIVTHDVVVRLLIAHCLGATTSIYRRLQVSNASLTIVRIIDGMCSLSVVNDTAHLESV